MPIIITDSDKISTVHTAERLQINLAQAKEDVEQMFIEVFFTIETKLPNGRVVGYPYWDNQAVRINCKGNPELTEAMKIIQNAIGITRYQQLTEPVDSPPIPIEETLNILISEE
jgi:hypothetical protein